MGIKNGLEYFQAAFWVFFELLFSLQEVCFIFYRA